MLKGVKGAFSLCVIMTLLSNSLVYAGTDISDNLERTQEEVIARFMETRSDSKIYDNPYGVEPSMEAPYSIGTINPEVANEGINELNFVRFLAGIPDDVVLDDSLAKQEQAIAYVNSMQRILTHYPTRPDGLPLEIYELAQIGGRSSNLAGGYRSLSDSIAAYMNDSDPSNISMVGHRRWILNPSMAKTMFGMVGTYSSMYSFDMSRKESFSYDYISWPSRGVFPIEYSRGGTSYDLAWSVSPNTSVYDKRKKDDIRVELRNISTGETYKFGPDESDGFFNVNSTRVGVPFSIIFQPDFEDGLVEDTRIEVIISGIYDLDGKPQTIQYETEFFSLLPEVKFFQRDISIGVGETLDLTYINEYSVNKYSYESNNDAIATVSEDGLIKGIGPGVAYIGFTTSFGRYKTLVIRVMENRLEPSLWAIEGYNEAKKFGIIPTAYDQTYGDYISRNDFTSLAVSFCENALNEGLEYGQETSFTDAKNSISVRKAFNAGLIKGTSATTFSPNDLITREQAALLMMNIVNRLDKDISPLSLSETLDEEDISDLDSSVRINYRDDELISDWAKDGVYEASKLGLIKGIGDGFYSPKGNLTYEQTYLMLLRIYKNYYDY